MQTTLPNPGRAQPLPPIVSAAWLVEHSRGTVVADVRWYLDGRVGRDAYSAGHIPGAIFVDLDRDLSRPAPTREGRHPLPSPESFAAAMSRLGIDDSSVVVAYDDAGGTVAGRLVFLLRVLGRSAALLDGGIQAWQGPLESGEVVHSPGTFRVRAWPPGRFASLEEVAAGGKTLLDARAAPGRYRGEIEPVDPRAGHIPGARSVPVDGNLDPTGHFLAPDVLGARFAAAGVAGGGDVIVYCGSGVTACHDLLAMEIAGVPNGRLYVGSWSEWSADPSRPAALGDDSEPGVA